MIVVALLVGWSSFVGPLGAEATSSMRARSSCSSSSQRTASVVPVSSDARSQVGQYRTVSNAVPHEPCTGPSVLPVWRAPHADNSEIAPANSRPLSLSAYARRIGRWL